MCPGRGARETRLADRDPPCGHEIEELAFLHAQVQAHLTYRQRERSHVCAQLNFEGRPCSRRLRSKALDDHMLGDELEGIWEASSYRVFTRSIHRSPCWVRLVLLIVALKSRTDNARQSRALSREDLRMDER